MNRFEDHFSIKALEYARYRPQYPGELYTYLASISPDRQLAWDCGTGNGQAALELAKHFNRVIATDASADQIALAVTHERIDYRVERVEDVNLEAGSVDLVTVATAVHWFDLEQFYSIVHRAGRPGAVIAVWVYHLPLIDPSIDRLMEHYLEDVLTGYWPEQFHYIDDRYRTLPFPFEEIKPPAFEMRANWDLDHFAGFLDSWSVTRNYIKERGQHPLRMIWKRLFELWGEPGQKRLIRWPLHMRVGRIN